MADPANKTLPPKIVEKLKEFSSMRGSAIHFVNYVKSLESRSVHTAEDAALLDAEVFRILSKSSHTGNPHFSRYLLTSTSTAPVIDFMHFFAAAALSYNGTHKGVSKPIATGTVGNTLLLGLANELAQCLIESIPDVFKKENTRESCFSNEDLVSNRVGATFGLLVKRLRTAKSTKSLSKALHEYLAELKPIDLVAGERLALKTKDLGDVSQLKESFTAILAGMIGFGKE